MNDGGEYVPLRERRPSVRNNLCRTVVDDSVSLLFSEGNFPTVECTDEAHKAQALRLVKELRLNEVMIDAATRGAVGSVAILLRVLDSRLFLNVIDTCYLTPQWNNAAPDTLQCVTEKRKVDGKSLQAAGYAIAPDDAATLFWFQRQWDAGGERWFLPWKVADDATTICRARRSKERRTPARLRAHRLDQEPAGWRCHRRQMHLPGQCRRLTNLNPAGFSGLLPGSSIDDGGSSTSISRVFERRQPVGGDSSVAFASLAPGVVINGGTPSFAFTLNGSTYAVLGFSGNGHPPCKG